MIRSFSTRVPALAGLALLAALSACSRMPKLTDEECLTRAMYFESNRSSPEGMLAVGTVVMNRVESGRYPKGVCAVVGQKKQFAPGVLSKPMGKGRDLARTEARKVLRGARHREVGEAMFFHTAGYSYPYNNMHYVAIAGGNAFYEKRRNPTQTQADVARRGDRLDFRPPARARAEDERALLAERMGAAPDAVLPAAGPAVSLSKMAPAPLPSLTIEQLMANEGLY